MSTLTTLKAAVGAKLASAEADVKNYVTELEASVKANKLIVVGAAAAGLLVGAVVGHLV